MLIWLLKWLEPWLQNAGSLAALDEVLRKITFRGALASVTAFLVAMLLGPSVIRWLTRSCNERIVGYSDELNRMRRDGRKDRVPTMGGVFILGALVGSVLLWGDLANRYVQLGLLLAVGLGALGAVDDFLKLAGKSDGLSVRQKLLGQTTLALVVSTALYFHHRGTTQGLELFVPFTALKVNLAAWFVPFGVVVLVATSNAVNLTDGLDGLAGGCLIFAGAAYAVLSYVAGHVALAEYLGVPYLAGSGDLSVVLGAVVGAVLGFLWFNCYPAQVFMGDTGSLPLGGLIGFAALVTRQEALLFLVGGVFVVEAVSVLVQVGWFKWTGRRLIRCAPLHHHFQFKGWHEMKVVVRFWIAAAVLAILAVATLKIQ